jgi:hypothetical protein
MKHGQVCYLNKLELETTENLIMVCTDRLRRSVLLSECACARTHVYARNYAIICKKVSAVLTKRFHVCVDM